ncbi:hemerythrin domain-containing protein [Peptoniphilus sp. SGI.035]|uniref:hemerythrin domain-containing protein n=1 Tax=unclassified Peptoniphilus TaxID=2637196 RepID=UPI0025EF0D8B|nr:hemerythrin domain-containing protein [Peptoniphilus sp.]MCI5643972.1 hemerythrin domain-containing protein [Peptoniphilus sp.]MDD7353435.1 hemerythrin domain-containing protein [Peptoniphilaceae bacterium]
MDTLKETINYLEDEHKEILIFCDKMEEKCLEILKGNVDEEFFKNAIIFIRKYADGRHHKKEEDILFKAMLENLGPVAEKVVRGGMLVEHQMARGYVMELENNLNLFEKSKSELAKLHILTNAMAYVELLRNHATKENNTVYPFAEKNLPEDVKKKVSEDMKIKIQEEKNDNIEKINLIKLLGI